MRWVSSRFFTASPRFVGGVDELVGELLGHALVAAARGLDDSQRIASVWRRVGAHLDRHLVGRAADAARLHLDRGRTLSSAGVNIDRQGVVARSCLDAVDAP